MDTLKIQVKRLHPQARLPRYAHDGPFGDLAADLFALEDREMRPSEVALIPTGISLEFPENYGALVEDRSGLAVQGLTTLAGVIDPGYRGEIKVVVTNVGGKHLMISAGDRIAQLRLVRRFAAEFVEVEEIAPTLRNEKGFGSSGK
jgi:dUTP diphosphatase